MRVLLKSYEVILYISYFFDNLSELVLDNNPNLIRRF